MNDIKKVFPGFNESREMLQSDTPEQLQQITDFMMLNFSIKCTMFSISSILQISFIEKIGLRSFLRKIGKSDDYFNYVCRAEETFIGHFIENFASDKDDTNVKGIIKEITEYSKKYNKYMEINTLTSLYAKRLQLFIDNIECSAGIHLKDIFIKDYLHINGTDIYARMNGTDIYARMNAGIKTEEKPKVSENRRGILDKVSLHKQICNELNALYETKNQDYGDSFGKGYKEYGNIMATIRLEDKLNRFKSLTKPNSTQKVNDESIRDTLIDLSNYAIMTIIEMDLQDKNKK